ncbi:hypothetical protein [Bordetella sp. N]|uniref:hypothetical protein n=1 Tax=Bordetella sp. N TaxID=1746199 RepID=UPI00070FCD83|nr:hypothetical protein [Bordetella sp. N]ALM86456.1 hypothetical protein ASB57_29135 [Bordetella sp. N]
MKISAPWHFARPDLARQYLKLLTAGPVQATTIFAPRRAGKTQFLMRDLRPEAEKAGFTVAYADLWQTQSPALALLQALEEAAEPKGAMGRVLTLLKPVKSVKASAKAAGVGGEVQLELGRANTSALTEIALRIDELIGKLTSGKRYLLLLVDEAQALARSTEGEQLARSLRTALTKHADRTRALFTGSSRTQLNSVFSNTNAPLYSAGHAIHDFPMLGREFVAFICKKFEASTGRKLDVEQAMKAHLQFHSRPEALVRCVVSMVLEPKLSLAAATRSEAARLLSADTHHSTWTALDALQRALIRQMADDPGYPPYAKASLAALGKQLGVPSLKATSVQKALGALSRVMVLTRTPEETWEFENENFRDWVKTLQD